MVYLFHTTYISGDLAHREIFCAKVGKGGIKMCINQGNNLFTFHNRVSF